MITLLAVPAESVTAKVGGSWQEGPYRTNSCLNVLEHPEHLLWKPEAFRHREIVEVVRMQNAPKASNDRKKSMNQNLDRFQLFSQTVHRISVGVRALDMRPRGTSEARWLACRPTPREYPICKS